MHADGRGLWCLPSSSSTYLGLENRGMMIVLSRLINTPSSTVAFSESGEPCVTSYPTEQIRSISAAGISLSNARGPSFTCATVMSLCPESMPSPSAWPVGCSSKTFCSSAW